MTLSDKIAQLQEFSNKLTKLRGPLRTQTRELKKILKNIINELNPENEESLVSLLEAGELQLELPITSENIADGSITTSKLADGAVDYSKLAIIHAAIPLRDTETTGSAILDFGISSGYFPRIISCYPAEYDDGANVGQIQRVYSEYDEQEDAFIFKIDVDAGPGEGKTVVYIINALKVPIPE